MLIIDLLIHYALYIIQHADAIQDLLKRFKMSLALTKCDCLMFIKLLFS